MNFDIFYSDKKPIKINQKDKEKILNLIFKIQSNPDRLLEFFIKEKKSLLFKNYTNYIKNFYIKNRVLYLEVESKFVLQEIQFMLPSINKFLDLHLNLKITGIKEMIKRI